MDETGPDYEEFEGTYDPRRAEKPTLPPVEIPAEKLSAEALHGVIENFILREGTDYGASEVTYEAKAKQVRRQLEKGDIKIVFDPNSESVTLMTAREFRNLNDVEES